MLPYINVITSTKETREINDNTSRTFNSIYSNPLLGKLNIIKGIAFTSGVAQTVSHKLGKAVAGFIVTNSNAPVNIYQPSSINPSPQSGIILESSGDAVVDILFFG